jgi:PhoPQ-activated pathogenicity-related protein
LFTPAALSEKISHRHICEEGLLMVFSKGSVCAMFAYLGATLFAPHAWADLNEYVRRPEPEFSWKLKEKIGNERSANRIYDLHFVSQRWQGNKWEHQLQIYYPRNAAANATMFLWVTGGSARPAYIALGLELARKISAPVAFLYNIPNQPLLENGLREDDLIAETFVRYLKSGDENWPLLFPMVKSVVKAMDVLQAFGKEEFGTPADKFIVSGASKRGWTTWLTAAVDQRVRAIAPVVIDTLNMRVQMPAQLKAFGAYSARLAPYSSRGLLPIPETPEGRRLLDMIDPWAYRDRLSLPKLIINGTNDFYWATDALNLYWQQLPGDKWVCYVPNAGHDLKRQDKGPADQLTDLVNGLAAFVRYQTNGKSMPALKWKHENKDGRLRLTIEARPAPTAARLWIAHAPTQDLRSAVWQERELSYTEGRIVGEIAPPEKGNAAFFGELDYDIDGIKYHLSTQVRVVDCKAEAIALRVC